MFEIGFWELVLVAVVALIVVGPEKLPGLARTAGLWVGKARRMIADVKAEVDRDLQLNELKQSFRQQADLSGLKEVTDHIKSLQQDIQAEFNDPGPPLGWHPQQPITPPPPSTDPTALATPTVPASTPVHLAKPAPRPVEPPSATPPSAPRPGRLTQFDPQRVGPPPAIAPPAPSRASPPPPPDQTP